MAVLSCSWWDPAVINSGAFRLHYKVTASILFALAAFIILLNWSSDPIDCILNDIPLNVVDAFCWRQDSFNEDMPQFHENTGAGDKKATVYQWVHCILLFQAICFLIPHLLWKHLEGGIVRSVTNGLRSGSRNADDRVDKQSRVVKYIKSNMNKHNCYTLYYFLCNVLNFVNVVYQICYIAQLPDSVEAPPSVGSTDWDKSPRNYTSNPLLKVFPRSIKCNIIMFGGSGTLRTFSALCFLPYNVISEKLFNVLYVWFIVLAVITAVCLLHLLLFVVVSPLRSVFLRKRLRLTDHDGHLHSWLHSLPFGDAFLVDLLGKNIDSVTLQEILDKTATGSKTRGIEEFESKHL